MSRSAFEDKRGKFINIGLNTLIKLTENLNKEKDPIIRHCCFIDKLETYLEISKGGLEYYMTDNGITDTSVLNNVDKIYKNIEEELGALKEWIKVSQFGPDSPYGKEMMKQSEKDFASRL